MVLDCFFALFLFLLLHHKCLLLNPCDCADVVMTVLFLLLVLFFFKFFLVSCKPFKRFMFDTRCDSLTGDDDDGSDGFRCMFFVSHSGKKKPNRNAWVSCWYQHDQHLFLRRFHAFFVLLYHTSEIIFVGGGLYVLKIFDHFPPKQKTAKRRKEIHILCDNAKICLLRERKIFFMYVPVRDEDAREKCERNWEE